ncbi:glycosyltransferase family 4 protein [Luteococcus sp. OSA5]|uniref:glycosyltransferase family 4 protein n=1 Tax=Luteococcus sp. OSA5 TaxID=3401630 RepID=UPI003B42C131
MRILFLTPNYFPTIGGAEAYAEDLTRALADRGHDVTVVTHSNDPLQPRLEASGFHRVIRVESGARPHVAHWEDRIFGPLADIYHVLANDKFDIIHANSHDTALLGACVSREMGVPLLVTSHEIDREFGAFGRGRGQVIFGLAQVDTFIAPSNYYASLYRRMGAPSVRAILHGVDRRRFTPEGSRHFRAKLGILPDSLLFLCPARFKERKGQLALVTAFTEYSKQFSNSYLVLCGSTSSGSLTYRRQVEDTISRSGMSGRIFICDNVERSQMSDVYRSCDAVVQPSRVEGLGLAVLEAMASGRPVAVAAAPGLDEVVPEAMYGERFDVRSVSSIKAALVALSDTDRRQELADRALGRVAAVFDFERMVAETENLYEEAIERD